MSEQIVFGTGPAARVACLRQVRALTLWARAHGHIGPTLRATDPDRFLDGQWGHTLGPVWLELAHGARVVLPRTGETIVIDLITNRREPVARLVDRGDGTMVQSFGCLESIRDGIEIEP